MKKISFFAVIFVILAFNTFSIEIPKLDGRISDYAGIISNSDKNEIEKLLEEVQNKTGAEIAILTIKSLQGESIEEFSYKTASKWALGQKEKDNGVLLTVAMEEHSLRIETGYGLEAYLTDTKCGLIIRNIIIPEFRKGSFSEGIKKGIQNIAGFITEEPELIDEKAFEKKEDDSALFSLLVGFLWIFGWFTVFSALAAGPKNRFLPWIIFTSEYHKLSKKHENSFFSNSFTSMNSGKTHFNGSGGHFGGGGASGKW